LVHEGDFSLADYPALIAWCDRIRALPGFVSMEGI
jgi:glutathione S-transferase